jgi:molybdopterin-guanine dinucleotide biosynthesis protein A
MARDIAGVVLAGGLARRMGGGDKCLKRVGGKAILDHVIERLKPQIGPIVLNANGDPARFAAHRLPVAADVVPGFAGPLAGVLTGMEWAAANAPGCGWIVTVAGDAPFVPSELVARLVAAIESQKAEMACVTSNGRDNPVTGLWPVRLASDLRRAVVEDGIHKVDAWTARYRLARAEFSAEPFDPFFNVNTPDDLAMAEALAARQ